MDSPLAIEIIVAISGKTDVVSLFYVIHAQPLRNNFTNQRFVVTIQICNELVCFMTAKSFVSVSNIFEASRFAIIDISKLDVMFKAKC